MYLPGIHILPVLCIVVLLGGCASAPPTTATIPELRARDAAETPSPAPPAMPAWLAAAQAPPRLAGLDRDGEISNDEQGWRRWVYGAPHRRLTLTLYGLPAGWDGLDDTRLVSGHYGQLRQQRVNRVYNSDDLSLRFVQERLFDLEGHVTASGAYLINRPNRRPLYETLLLTLDGDRFIRIEAASREQDTTALLRLSKRALAEFRAFEP
ncbi:hypothetical protein [Alloalcanivorax profundimaris]|uniref:hypothetical protein n=1 Tax=Alloalcanivorax profundimaris TaxID=2735259 RepID=UPI001887B83F|nr:hypothetical protein [Alloalcanivorax profundimaris]MBF1801871.1 hypothetical protein [Alloalcanivorax profundimaris]